MSHSRVFFMLALLATVVGALTPCVASSTPVPTLSIAALSVQPAPLTPTTTPPLEELFVYAQVRYSGESDVLHLNPTYFRLKDSSGVLQPPIPYAGVNPLLPQELVGQAQIQGWLLFAMPLTDTANLSLYYEQSHSGNIPALLPHTLPFTPRPSALRAYATAAQAALDGYLGDEARATGYLLLNIEPIQPGATASPTADDRAFLLHQHARLVADHAAFDHIAPGGKEAASLRAQADRAFSAIEADLVGLDSVHTAPRWAAWLTAFTRDDHALADLYQAWPGAQLAPITAS